MTFNSMQIGAGGAFLRYLNGALVNVQYIYADVHTYFDTYYLIHSLITLS